MPETEVERKSINNHEREEEGGIFYGHKLQRSQFLGFSYCLLCLGV
jgi:hypothetical protein